MNLNNQIVDQAFLMTPLLRFAEIVEEGASVPDAMRQMHKELTQFIASRKGQISRAEMNLENWKASIKIPRTNGGNKKSASL